MIQLAMRFVNDIKLRTKLFLSFIFVVFVPVLTVGIFLTNEMREMALESAIEQTESNIGRVKARTLEVLNVSSDIAYRLAYDDRLEDVANRRYRTTYEVVSAYRSYPDFDRYLTLYNEIANIRLYIDNPTLLNNWEFLPADESIRSTVWYRKAADSFDGTIGWYYIQDERDNRYYVSLVRKVNFLEEMTSGVLVINVNMNLLDNILSQETFETMIVDDSNTIVSANRPERIGLSLDDIDFSRAVAAARDGSFETEVDDVTSQIIIEPLVPSGSINGLRIVSVFAIDEITGDINRINMLALFVISITLVAALFLIYGFSSMLTNRMRRLSSHITRVATGKLDIVAEIEGKDEIARLARQFNAMVLSINELMGEVKESNRQKHMLERKQDEIKLKMMASQINPHFLFNALESIRMKAHLKGENDIAQVVRLLGKLMRKNLEVGGRNASLDDEMDIVRCYLDIQKFRYEDRLRYELDIGPGAGRTPVPPLIVQPLVENAVVHGLENKEGSGSVCVRARSCGRTVRVEVIDDGAGMDGEQLDALRRSIDEPDDDGGRIGLRNVHSRLQLSYGREYGLRIESKGPGAGTRIYFSIPTGGKADV